MARNQHNLRTLSTELGTRLGLVVNTNQTYNIAKPLLHSFLQDAAEQLHEQFGQELLREKDYPFALSTGVTRYALPAECDPYRINNVSVQVNGTYQSLRQGIPLSLRNSDTSASVPMRWALLYDDASELVPSMFFDRWLEQSVPYGWTKHGTHDATNYVRPYDSTTDIAAQRGITFTGDDSQQAGVEIDEVVTASVDYIVEYEYSVKTTGSLELILGGASAAELTAAASTRTKIRLTAGSGDEKIIIRPKDGTSVDCTLTYLSVTLASERPRFQVEFWPEPDISYTARIDFYRQLGAFTEDTDICPVEPSRLVFLHALINAKAHYDQPDAQIYIAQMEQLLRQVRARQHGTERHFMRYAPAYADIHATFTPIDALIDTDGDYLVEG